MKFIEIYLQEKTNYKETGPVQICQLLYVAKRYTFFIKTYPIISLSISKKKNFHLGTLYRNNLVKRNTYLPLHFFSLRRKKLC